MIAGAERREPDADRLQRDAIFGEDRDARGGVQPRRGTVHVQGVRARWDHAFVQNDAVALDASDVAEAHDVLDATELGGLTCERSLIGTQRTPGATSNGTA